MKIRAGIGLVLAVMVVLPFVLSCASGGEGEGSEGVETAIPAETQAPVPDPSEAIESKPTHQYTAVSSGAVHTCALRVDGAIDCWGADTAQQTKNMQSLMQGQANPPEGVRFVAISSGYVHTCGLKEDGSAVCWGSQGYDYEGERNTYNVRGQASPPADEQFRVISSGWHHTCGLREDGIAVCWGDDEEGQSTPPDGERLKAIASGGRHTCGIRMDNTVVCWGLKPNTDGLHGFDGPPEGQFSSIDGAPSHTCGLRLEGTIDCWGYWGDVPTPGLMPTTGDTMKAISFGGKLGCGLRADSSAYCWGYQLPIYPTDYEFSDISAGGDHICAIRNENGKMVCWGNDDFGQSSPPDGERFVWNTDGSLPVEPLSPYIDVSAGYYHACALRADGAAVCWGAGKTIVLNENPLVHLGQASSPGAERFVSISSGGWHTCGLRADGKAVCWGYSVDGRTIPPEGERFTAIASGRHNTCGLRTDSTVICWGWDPGPNSSAALDETPVGHFSVLDNGGVLACGILFDGQVECWGYRNKERSYDEYPPAHIEGGLKAISFGVISGCGIRVNDSPFCWGYWGHPYPKDQYFTDISVGWGHTCAIRKNDGGLVCWGDDDFGEGSPPGGERFE